MWRRLAFRSLALRLGFVGSRSKVSRGRDDMMPGRLVFNFGNVRVRRFREARGLGYLDSSEWVI